ncbi:hypothetical protein VP1G_01455 [Cytospora mali]|uniref:Uncharacterized protein n=1 Tax=Cytospora mali TaxID=578113 RepID=A0A194UQV5_CYTMA|nr:hypothetical protein VP1G_01455 [Valsa mali var. pyri (nom. inval.)]
MPVLKLDTQAAAQGATLPKPVAPTGKNPTPGQAAGTSSGSGSGSGSGPEPAAPVPEPLSPQFRPISTTPIPPPTIPSFASGRQTFTHREHPPQVESVPPPPPPEPIDFRDNVDVIALESAILLLQRQKKQAEEDIRQLRRIKEEAIAKPSDFVQDLATGRVGGGGGGGGADQQGAAGDADDDDDDSDEEEREEDGNSGEASENGLKPSPMEASTSSKGKAAAGSSNPAAAPQPSWTTLPKPQDVVRMPAINWSKYAVVGESLDKLHSEQLARPTLGTPAMVGANGTYEFKGGPNPDDGKWIGVSAPYDPLKDKLKPKGAKRGG